MNLSKLKSLCDLAKFIIIKPKNVFLGIKEGKYSLCIILSFLLCSIMTFYKSYFLKGNDINFYVSEKTNSFFSLMSNPQIKWFMMHIYYFLFILIIITLLKIFNKKVHTKKLILAIMSISVIGLIVQIISIILLTINIDIGTESIFYLLFMWIILLSISAVKYIEKITIYKSFLFFIIPALFFTFTFGLPSICPYLTWIIV
jgi:hypothetical protein